MNKFPYKHISVLIMPTDFCNMNCIYCFNERRTSVRKKIMTMETVEKIFKIIIPYYEEIYFIWHGGEPLSMGKNFYENVLALQKEINVKGAVIRNSIQSNLTLVNEELARFLIQNDFHIGSSFDGTQNELTRHNSRRILDGHEQIKKYGGSNGFICVVQSKNINHLIEDYEWFKRNNMNYTLNLYMAKYPYEGNELFVPADQAINRVCEFYDYWMFDQKCNIRISYFDEFLNYILFKRKSICCYKSCLGKHVGIHYDGSIYCCNRDFPEEYCFGNIYDYSDIHECFESQGFQNMLVDAIARRTRCKDKCELYEFCTGGCNSSALMGGNLRENNEYVCRILTAVYKHILEQVTLWMTRTETEINKMLNPNISEKLVKYKNNLEHPVM